MAEEEQIVADDPVSPGIPSHRFLRTRPVDKDASPQRRWRVGRRVRVYPATVAQDAVHVPWLQDGYYWSTPKSAIFLGAIIVLALIFAKLLAPLIEL
jgi:hypothetical protein